MKPCECGCGELIDDINKHRPGTPKRYKYGHSFRGKSGENSYVFKGGIRIREDGYIDAYRPNHHEAKGNGYVFYHRIVYESFHKCCLLPWAILHHIDGNPRNNFPNNLEIVSDHRHKSLHLKQMWQDSETRPKLIAHAKNIWNDPELRKRMLRTTRDPKTGRFC